MENKKTIVYFLSFGLVFSLNVIKGGFVLAQRDKKLGEDIALIKYQLLQYREEVAAFKQEIESEINKQNQLLREVIAQSLMKEIETMQKNQLDIIARINALTRDLQTINGKLELQKERIDKTLSRLDSLESEFKRDLTLKIGNINNRLDKIEQKMIYYSFSTASSLNLSSGYLKEKMPSIPDTGSLTEIVELTDPQQIYKLAYRDYIKGNYELAIEEFKEFLKRFPKAELADKAQYYIGECYYAKKQYAQALEEFDKLISNYPKSDKIPAALLKKSFIYRASNQEKLADEMLLEIIKRFPNSEEAKIAEENLGQ